MVIKVLMAQRFCDYEGQYAPEAIACVTQTLYDDYSDWFDSEYNGAIRSKEYTSVKVVKILVNSTELNQILFPPNPVLIGTVIEEQESK